MSAPTSAPTSAAAKSPTTDRRVAAAFDDDEERPHDLVVTVGAQAFGIPVEQVREVRRPGVIVRVPGAPQSVVGIVNVRGAVVTVLDLSVLLTGVRAVTAGSIVLIEHGTRLVGLAVQTVRDVRATVNAGDSPQCASPAAEEIVPLDAAALCARHLLSSEEMGS